MVKSFYTKTAAKNKVPVAGGNPVSAVFCKRPVKESGSVFLFPVEITYTSFLPNCPWVLYLTHSITAIVVTEGPLPRAT